MSALGERLPSRDEWKNLSDWQQTALDQIVIDINRVGTSPPPPTSNPNHDSDPGDCTDARD